MKKKSKLTILVDIDNVLNDFAQKVIEYYNRDNDTTVSFNDVNEYSLENALNVTTDELIKYFNDEELLNSCVPPAGAQKYLKLLNELANIYIVTARDFKQLFNIDEWFAKWFPYIQNQQLIRCRDKHLVQGDIRIDDHYDNLKASKCGKILFSYPYNANVDLTNELIYRVYNWEECFSACMLMMGYSPTTINKYISGGNDYEQFNWNCRVE